MPGHKGALVLERAVNLQIVVPFLLNRSFYKIILLITYKI